MLTNEQVKELYKRQRLLAKDKILIKPSNGKPFKLNKSEVEEIKALAVDGVIPIHDYISKCNEILNRESNKKFLLSEQN